MNRLDEIKDKFKDLGTLGGSDVTWLFMKIKDLERQLNDLKGEFNENDLLNISNKYHDIVYDYIENHGFDEKLKMEFKTKIEWLKFVADKNEVELDF